MATEEDGISTLVASDTHPDFTEITVEIRPESHLDYVNNPPEVPAPPELSQPLIGRKSYVSLKTPYISEIYLRTLVQTGRYTAATAACGCSLEHQREFRKKYPEFQALCDEALERYTASLEAEAHRRAVHGTAEPVYHQGVQVGVVMKKSDKLLLALLKRRDPSFREESGKGTTVNVHTSATAAAQGAPTGAPAMDPARMTKAQREAYRAFLATMAPGPAGELPEATESPPQAVLDVPTETPEGIQVRSKAPSGDE